MQTIEKALHQPMPFTTGGQTISDRLTAAKHSLAGSQLGKTICKATTEELMAPKKKHLDYLLHCTNEPNVSIPSMANLLIERTQHPSWTVVYKALITIHNIMCYGNERFSQYLASCNTTFNLGNFLDKNSTSGYDMSQHVRRYGKYIGEKIATYRVCAFDFCKVKRGREDGLLRTMHTDKLLKTLPILQNQIDALLEFQVSSSELNNGVINCSFILLFRDLIRLFACYNDGIINLLEKYFDMNKKQCKDALDTYKSFLTRLDKVADFLRVAESVGIDRGEIPDLTRAPASLLEALEAHLIHLEGGRAPPPSQYHPGAGGGGVVPHQMVNNFSMAGGFQAQAPVGEQERNRYIELEKERLRQFEEQKRQQGATTSQFNPFAAEVGGAAPGQAAAAPPEGKKQSDDLLDLFNAPQQPALDSTNPFAQFTAPAPQQQQPVTSMYPGAYNSSVETGGGESNPFLAGGGAPPVPPPPQQQQQQQWQPEFGAVQGAGYAAEAGNPFAAGFEQGYQTEEQCYNGQGVVNAQPYPAQVQQPSVPIPVAQQQRLGIYEQTPFSHGDGSYTSAPAFPPHMMQAAGPGSVEQSPAHQGYPGVPQPPGSFDPFNTQQQPKIGGDIDSAMSSMVQNLNISKGAQPTSSVQWGGAPPARPPAPSSSMAPMGQQPMMYGGATNNMSQQYPAAAQYGGGAPQMGGWGMQQPGMYQQPQYNMYQNQQQPAQMAPMQYQQAAAAAQQPKDPFSGF